MLEHRTQAVLCQVSFGSFSFKISPSITNEFSYRNDNYSCDSIPPDVKGLNVSGQRVVPSCRLPFSLAPSS